MAAAAGGAPPPDLEALLVACLSFDNQVRKQAEDAVRQLSGRPEVVPELLGRVRGAASPDVRQLAAVLLRKWVARHWDRLTLEVRAGVQQVLLERIAHEPVHSVRRALADVVASVAQLSVPEGQWQGLLEFLHQCSRADSPEHREVALLLFAALFETIGEHLQPHVPLVLQTLAASARHPSALVQAAALAAIEPLLPSISDQQVPAFHELLAALLPCAQAALAAGNEELLVQLCQVLVEVAESPAPLLQPCMQQVLEMSMTVATNKAFAWSTREHALHLLHWVAKFKPKQLTRLKPLLRATVDALCEMCCEPPPEDLDDAQELPPHKAAAQALDVLAIELPSQAVFPPVWQFVQAVGGSPEPHRRAAAMMVLAVLAEGCAEPLRKRLPQALPRLLASLADARGEVRAAAAFALGQFSEHLQPDILEHYREVMPRLFALLRDPDHDVQERACYALDAFCENLEATEIRPYMQQLVEQLLLVLQHSARPGVQEMALSAISSIAAAAEGAFQPYTAQVLPVIDHFMHHAGQDHLLCRCRAIEAAGILAAALGPSDPVMGPHIQPLLAAVLHCWDTTDSPDLRDVAHTCLANIAKSMGEAFAPALPRVVPLALHSCLQADGALGDSESEGGSGGGSELGGDSGSGDEEGGARHFSVRTGVTEEKVSAAAALGGYAEACPAGFMPYAEQALSVLRDMAHYWHEEGRAAAYESLHKLLRATHAAFPPQPAAHGGGGGGGALSPQTLALADAALPLLAAPADDDVSKAATAAAAAALAHSLKDLGRGAVAAGHLEAAAKAAAAILRGNTLCQEVEGDDDGEELEAEDAGAEDEDLLAAGADLLPALAASMGADAYAPVFFSMHAQPLLSRLRPQQPVALRAIAAGSAAEVAEALGGHMAEFVAPAMPLLLRELQADDDINRQNAAYCAGLLVEAAPAAAAPFLQQLLAALHGLFGDHEAAGARDNAVGAVGRIMCALTAALPLPQVLPVLLGALPLKEDVGETVPVVKALYSLLAGDPAQPDVQPHVPRIVQVLGDVAVQAAVPMEAKVMGARALAALQGRYPQQASPLLAALPPEQQAALQQLVASAEGEPPAGS